MGLLGVGLARGGRYLEGDGLAVVEERCRLRQGVRGGRRVRSVDSVEDDILVGAAIVSEPGRAAVEFVVRAGAVVQVLVLAGAGREVGVEAQSAINSGRTSCLPGKAW